MSAIHQRSGTGLTETEGVVGREPHPGQRGSLMGATGEADQHFVVIGAGPAGLTAAYEIAKLGFRPVVVEQHKMVGGLACTAQYRGYYFDMGGHRFFTKVEEIKKIWRDVLHDNFLRRP